VGIVVLKRLTDAIADGDCIHAVIKGSAINNDGSGKVGYSAEREWSNRTSAALFVAEVEPETVNYIEAHGMEPWAIRLKYSALKVFVLVPRKGLLRHRFSQNKYRSSRCSCWSDRVDQDCSSPQT